MYAFTTDYNGSRADGANGGELIVPCFPDGANNNNSSNNSLAGGNGSNLCEPTHPDYHNPFDYIHIKVIFILLYLAVFVACFVGEYCTKLGLFLFSSIIEKKLFFYLY